MHARAIKKHREYEIVYLLAPSTTPGRAEKVGDSVREVLEEAQGKLLKVTLWGIRALAFKIKGHRQGIYYYTRFIATQGAVDEIERRLKLADSVLRYLTVRLSKHEVDPADYTVKEEEASFKGIDDLHASLQERSAPAAEVQAETAPAPAVKPKAEAVDEKKPAPAVKPKAEAVDEKKPAPAVKPKAEAVDEKKPAPAVKPKAEAVDEKKPAPAVKPKAEAVDEKKPAPAVKPKAEAVDEKKPAPAVKPKAKAVDEKKPAPAVKPKAKAVDEKKPAPAVKPKAKAVDEKKPAPAVKPKAKAVDKKKDKAKGSGDDSPKVEKTAPAKKPEKAKDKDAETEEKS